ncbi:MAG: SoxR reducing system RseC family protein [Desulfobacterales bacterium]
MALEEGIVTRTNGETAFITTRRTTACEGCSERHVCHSMGNVKEIEIEVANPLGAKPGDTVLVTFKTSQLVTLSFMLYVFPIIAMLIGALFGNSVAENFSGDPSIFAAVFGFLFFGIAMSAIKLKDNQAKKTGQYRPVITEIKKKGPPGEPENLSGCTMCGPD